MVDSILEPILVVHISLVLCVFLLIPYQLWLGRRASRAIDLRLHLSGNELRARKGIEWRILLALAVVSFGMGSFRCESGHCWLFYIGVVILTGIAFGLERLLEHMVPEGSRRHRMIGALTLSAILLLFASTTAMYALLYVLYPHLAH